MTSKHLGSLFLIALLAFSFIAFFSSISQTNLYISDSVPLSYVSAVLLMLFIQLVFLNNPMPDPDRIGAVLAAIAFSLSASVFIFLPQLLSLNFWYYRMDLLAFAFFFSGACYLLFGSKGVKSIRFTQLFAFLAWPVLAFPLAGIEPALAQIASNILIVILNLMGLGITLSGTVFSFGNLEQVTIAPECVAISAVLGFIAFTIPLAFFLEGKVKSKLAWLFSGILMILALNLARLFTVLLLWRFNGTTNAVGVFHAISGNLMFNLTFVIMVLAIPIFKLKFPFVRGVSFITGRFSDVAADVSSTITRMPRRAIAVLSVLLVVSLAFNQLDNKVQDYAWLSQFEKSEFTTALPSPTNIPDDWIFIASQSNSSEESNLLGVVYGLGSKNGTQIQLTLLSSANSSMLGFDLESTMQGSGYLFENSSKIYLSKGIYATLVHFGKYNSSFQAISWAQPAIINNKSTYLVEVITIGSELPNETEYLVSSVRKMVG